MTIDAEAFNRFEAAGWEARAASYAFLQPITNRVITSLLGAAEVGRDQQVLDVGCGPGDLAGAAAALGADTVGIDAAPSMVRLAAIAHPSIPFRVGSFEAIPAGEDAFDAVVGNFVLNHVGRPGLPAGPTHFRSDDELRKLFLRAGFTDVGVSHVMFEAPASDTETLWRGVLDSAVRIPPLVEHQPADVKARIRDAFERLAAVHRRTDGALAIPVAVQVTRGRRP